MVVCDGIADRPIQRLGGRTPLEAAETPTLDAIAKAGVCGLVDTIAPGIRPGSDTAHLAILGYDPFSSYTGRGPFEAAGVGMEVRPGDVALRCNFATLDEKGLVVDRRAGRICEGTAQLAESVNTISLPEVELRFKESTGHRGALVLRGMGLSHRVSDSDPHVEGLPPAQIRALEESEEAERTARLLNSFIAESRGILEEHPVNKRRVEEGRRPANILLLRGAGVAPHLKPFKEKYGLDGGCIATVALVRGVGRFCGLKVLGAEPDMSIPELVGLALNAVSELDFLLLNIKAGDDATHDGDVERKIRIIEEIDSVAQELLEFSRDNYLALLADHTSSITRRDHSGDPVPVVIAGPEVRVDEVNVFSERAVVRGGLLRLRGKDIMNIIIDLMNRSEKFGA